jgi:hypothetical protein
MGCGIVRDKERNPVGFICGDAITPCSQCGDPSDYLCDFPVGDGKICDLPLCGFHTCEVGEEKHFCPTHTAMYRASGASRLIERGKLELVPEKT